MSSAADDLHDGQDTALRVVIAWPYLAWGGAQTYLAGVCRHLPPAAVVEAVVPLGTDPVLLAYLHERGIATHVGGPAIDDSPARSLAHKALRRLHDARAHAAWAGAILRRRPQVVHVDLTPWTSTLVLLWLARRAAVVCTMHTPLDGHRLRRSWRWRARLLFRSGRVSFVAASLRPAQFHGRWLGAGSPLPIIESGADEAELAGIERIRHDGLIVGAGQLIHRKGIDLLIDALPAVLAAHPHATVRWLGDGPERAALERRAQQTGVGAQIRFDAPSAARADHLAAVAEAAVYVQPSRDDGMPQAILEAMALGVPTVATDVGSVATVVRDGDTGMLLATADPGALATAICALLARPAHAEQLGAAGREAVRLRFSAREAAARHLHLYRQVVAARAR